MFEPERGVMRRFKKRGDPGCFTVPCIINGEPFEECVLDLGASKSVMPLHVSKDIFAGRLERTNITLTLADWSTIKPLGIIREVDVTLQGDIVPTDFLIEEMKGKSDQIILGRPFLSSAGAEIKVLEGRVDFRLSDLSRKVWISRDTDPDKMGEVFNPIKANYLQDLAAAMNKHMAFFDESSLDLDKYGMTVYDPKWKKPPDISGIKLWDEGEPSNGKTRMNEIVGNGAGTSKTSSSKDKGKGKMPDFSEIDPGDKPNANPGDLSSF